MNRPDQDRRHHRSAPVTELADWDRTRLARAVGVLREAGQARCALCGIPLADPGQFMCTRCAYR